MNHHKEHVSTLTSDSDLKDAFEKFGRANLNMNHHKEHRLVIKNLVPSTSDSDLKDAFKKFGHLVRANVFMNVWTGECTGYGLLVFDNKPAMEAVIHKLDDDEMKMEDAGLYGQSISVSIVEPGLDTPPTGVYRFRSYGVGGGGFGEDCYKCGKPGHLAQKCIKKVSGRGVRSRGTVGGSRQGSTYTRHRPSPYDRYTRGL